MPGGGITEGNIARILPSTGAREIHLSGRESVSSGMKFQNPHCSMGAFSKDSKDHEYEWQEASAEKIRRAKNALTTGVS